MMRGSLLEAKYGIGRCRFVYEARKKKREGKEIERRSYRSEEKGERDKLSERRVGGKEFSSCRTSC
jgi:hypothetical protein